MSNIYKAFLVFNLFAASAVMSSAQTPAPKPTPDTKVKDRDKTWSANPFRIVKRVTDIPVVVKKQFPDAGMQKDFSMAEPGQPFQVTDVIADPRLPGRRLIFAGISKEHCFVYYERGGIAHMYQIVVFHLSGREARFMGGLYVKPFLDWKTLKASVLDKPLDTGKVYF